MKARINVVGLALALAALLTPCATGLAQDIPGLTARLDDDAATAPDPASPAAIEARRSAVVSELLALDQNLQKGAPAQVDHNFARRARLQAIDDLLVAHVALRSRTPRRDTGAAPTSSVPSPFALNTLYEARFAAQQQGDEGEERLEASREALAAAKARLDETEMARRRARVEFDEATPDAKAKAAELLELRELDSRVAREEVYLRRAETRVWQRAESDEVLGELEDQIDAVRDALGRGEGTTTLGNPQLAERERQLLERREATERRLGIAELALEAAQRRYVQRPVPSAETLEEVEALTAHRDLLRRQVSFADTRLARLAEQRETWAYWGTLLAGRASRDELDAWESRVEEQVAALGGVETEFAGRISELDRTIKSVESRFSRTPEDSTLRRTLGEELQTLSRLRQEQQLEAARASADRRVAEIVLADIHREAGDIDWKEYAAEAAEIARDVWNYEITTVEDASITVGSVVLAFLLFIVGLWAARKGSSIVAGATKRRFKLDSGAAHAFQTLTFYALLVSFTLLALRAIHFPLTAFTVLGGALAIGVGFGSQNVMNNFISGLILMLERPVRAHDLVEVDGNHGTIEKIGARSTQIRSADGRHIIVPNSFFLQSNVVNWTLSDDLIRAKVSVGVIYGSPTRLVEQLVRKVIAEDEMILKTPGPVVVFEEFGDNSLVFDVYFWIRARAPMDVRNIQSRVRFGIDDEFRQNDLVIAFPQRDVHIDSASPLEVRVLADDGLDTKSKPDPK